MNRSSLLRQSTVPRVLCERAGAEPARVALRAKRLGLYEERSWRALALLVARLADGFAALEVRKGDRVAIMGDACEQWLVCDLAAQALGAITYGIYPTASIAEVEHQMRDGGASVFVAENQEYVDKILPLADALPGLAWIVVIDPTAMFTYDDARLKAYDALLAGQVADRAVPPGGATEATHDADEALLAGLERRAAAVHPDDAAFIVYTSGTTGAPKGALVSHGRHLAGAFNMVTHYPLLAQAGLRTVVFLPLCHVLGRDVAITLPLIAGVVPHFGESVEDLATTLHEVAPDFLVLVPRYLQKFAAQVLIGIANTSPAKRRVHEAAMRAGRRHARARWAGGPVSSPLYAACRLLSFGPVLSKLGFDRLRLVISGGAPLPPETAAFWQILGVNLCEVYGQTEEAGAIISGQRGPFPRPGNVGTLADGWQLKLDPQNGEILLKGDHVFDGYWNDPEASAQAWRDGWLATGDVGAWDDTQAGHLKLVDRARDFIVTSGSKTISPSYIENLLRGSPYIGEAMVIGHARKYLTALIEIDADTVADWARANAVSYTGFTSLTAEPRVIALLGREIERVNADLARVEQIKQFRILPKALDPEEEGEPVTPTRKLKRALMIQRFAALVEAMYDDQEERALARAAGEALAGATPAH